MKQKGKSKCEGKKAGKNENQKQPSKKHTHTVAANNTVDRKQGDEAFLEARAGFKRIGFIKLV